MDSLLEMIDYISFEIVLAVVAIAVTLLYARLIHKIKNKTKDRIRELSNIKLLHDLKKIASEEFGLDNTYSAFAFYDNQKALNSIVRGFIFLDSRKISIISCNVDKGSLGSKSKNIYVNCILTDENGVLYLIAIQHKKKMIGLTEEHSINVFNLLPPKIISNTKLIDIDQAANDDIISLKDEHGDYDPTVAKDSNFKIDKNTNEATIKIYWNKKKTIIKNYLLEEKENE